MNRSLYPVVFAFVMTITLTAVAGDDSKSTNQTPKSASAVPATTAVQVAAPTTTSRPPEATAPLSAEALFKQASPAVVQIVVRDESFKEIALGSGFFVKADGTLVTNYHVIQGAKFATVQQASGTTFFVDKILAWDATADLAVLSVNAKDLPYLELVTGDHAPAIGAHLYAIGNPRGLTNSLSDGLLSGLRKLGEGPEFLQTTTAISPGSSGGPLLDNMGRVVGVTAACLEGGQNLNLAVPASSVRSLLAKANTSNPIALRSAGGKPLDAESSKQFHAVYEAIVGRHFDEALKVLTKLRESDPKNSVVWWSLGIVQNLLHNDDLAVDAFKTAIHLSPEDGSLYADLGIQYFHMNRFEEAEVTLRTAVHLKPDCVTGYLGLGALYTQQPNRAEDAIAALKTAITLDGDSADAYFLLGKVYYNSGRYNESIASCEKSIHVAPKRELNAYVWLGCAHLAAGHRDKAMEVYRTLKELNVPESPAAASELLRDIQGK